MLAKLSIFILAGILGRVVSSSVGANFNILAPRNTAENATSETNSDYGFNISQKVGSLGADNVKQYSGYFNMDAKDRHLFFWFFESRNDPKNDPVILWLNGGPGCSSLQGLLGENGPSRVDKNLNLTRNPFSWNNNATVIYLDQPVNVGFSWTVNNTVGTTKEAAVDVYAFLESFFHRFPEYSELPFHIAGESYAGHYIPAIALEILRHDDRPFNFDSIAIGNGITDMLLQSPQYPAMACGEGGHVAVLSNTTCTQMYSNVPQCQQKLTNCYANITDDDTCVDAQVFCQSNLMGPYTAKGLNTYDLRGMCDTHDGVCYSVLDYLHGYLVQDYVMEALGAKSDIQYTGCKGSVSSSFQHTGDWSKPFQQNVAALLEEGYGVLVYAGDQDFIGNWLGQHAWTDHLPWSGHAGFANASFTEWTANGNSSGQAKNSENFTFLRVYQSGHMVPHDQPQSALYMINSWISGNRAFK